ncbi:MAG TPA: hypothetical protein DCL15_01650 [Chloroflexi bacterium]|nr:hypothetical protein [Chloroflexota bacterium]HHW87642.1 hypothetical protein [Chloroflexota bacterium]
MSRQNLALAGVGLLVLLALAFLGWAALRPLPTSPAAITPQVDATPPPTVAPPPTALPDATTSSVVATELYTVTLPEGWQWTTQAWTGDAPVTASVTPVVIAWPAGSSFETSLTRLSIATLPRQALSLERYLLDVNEVFSSTAGVDVLDARVVTDLRHDGLPVAFIRYIMPASGGEVSGRQAATFDASGTHLLIVTLVNHADSEESERLFRTLVGALNMPTIYASGE